MPTEAATSLLIFPVASSWTISSSRAVRGQPGEGMIGAGFAFTLLVDETFHHRHGQAPGEERFVLLHVAHGGDQFGVGV